MSAKCQKRTLPRRATSHLSGDFADKTFCAPIKMQFSGPLGDHLFSNPPAKSLMRRFLHFRSVQLRPTQV